MKADFMNMIETFNENNFEFYCNHLAKQDDDLKLIIDTHGYPPLFMRSPTFETLLHIILEQQVSLASAKAALHKLKEKIGIVLPEKLLLLTDIELRACYFSRQKIGYIKDSAINNNVSLSVCFGKDLMVFILFTKAISPTGNKLIRCSAIII